MYPWINGQVSKDTFSGQFADNMEHSLSSPNHNQLEYENQRNAVALYPLSSPNHNRCISVRPFFPLRYILFHHQTTTEIVKVIKATCCVISSFITKPQRLVHARARSQVALYPLSSPNHNPQTRGAWQCQVALYPLSSPNHNCVLIYIPYVIVALYPLSSPNHNPRVLLSDANTVALYPLSSPNHNLIGSANMATSVALYPLSSPNHNC